mgnify:CR=1 FL=1|tara:strand:- start:31757 stop:32881 length:1125 start_codon:yes stop_codon:yes gene_type:complete
MIRWVILIIVVLCIDFYAFQSIKTMTKNKIVHSIYWLISIAVLSNFIYRINTIEPSKGIGQQVMFAFGLVVLTLTPKIIAMIILFAEDIFRVIKLVFNYFSNSSTKTSFPSRRDFVSKLALGLAAIPFASVLYGMARGKYNYQVLKHTLFFDDLPTTFDGFKLTHISDIHSGSFDDEAKIIAGIDLINEQQSDVILFTGDIVNNTADEMDPWIPHFKKLNAKDGKYSILGNHDYGEYARWKTDKEKETNFQAIKDIHPKIGFNLLLNDSVYLEKGTDKIALIGVENWGTRFKKAGDLNLASLKINNKDFKILLSHDPSHWETEVKNHPNKYHLTLSGHTHGMQFGIEIPGIKWSPVQYIYINIGLAYIKNLATI